MKSLLMAALLLQPAKSTRNVSSQLRLVFGPGGLTRLDYGSQTLVDTQRWANDRFHIWHMKCWDLQGRPLPAGLNDWGEKSSQKLWDEQSKTWTYIFPWGEIRTTYEQRGDELQLRVTTVNRPDSGLIVDGASVFPVTLHLPGASSEGDVRDNLDKPGTVTRRWNGGSMGVVPQPTTGAAYTGLQPGENGALAVLVSGTKPDALPDSADRGGQRVMPGHSASVVVSLGFGESGERLRLAVTKAWTTRWPQVLSWSDRRVIGSVFMAESGKGDKTRPAGFPNNPRRFFKDPQLDVRHPAGLEQFQGRLLAQADEVVKNLRRLNAQGVITWDIEGQEYPQDTSYVCAPDQIARAAPEMESILKPGMRYSGMKVDDAYFKIIRDAGFRVGVCIRPQAFTMGADGRARQQMVPEDQVVVQLVQKMKFARERWGATMFYVDSTVGSNGVTLPSDIVDQAARAMPGALLIPEESLTRMFRATAPFGTFLFHGDLGTSAEVRTLYPHAFTVNMINDAAPSELAKHRGELVQAVRGGDVLMVHAGYWHPNNEVVVGIEREAGRRVP